MERISNLKTLCTPSEFQERVLRRTNYGIDIYAHILKKCFPEDEIVLRLSGRDCGLCRNPFAEGERTLHIFIVKTDPNDVMSAEYARHTTTDHSIPDGDALSFAEMYYHLSGQELLETLIEEMHLHIGKKEENQIISKFKEPTPAYRGSEFSFFSAPITNIRPSKNYTLFDAYQYIIGDTAKERTEKLRTLTDAKQSRMYKAANFDYCTFSGTFKSRSDKDLINHSGLLCIDFDHLQKLDLLRSQLLQDEYFDTQLLFRSPSGDGLKWIIEIDISTLSHANFFRAVANYIHSTYDVEVDKSGKDISRACFLPHDPQAFINPKFLTYGK